LDYKDVVLCIYSNYCVLILVMEDLLHNMSAAESTVITEQEKTNFVINVNDI